MWQCYLFSLESINITATTARVRHNRVVKVVEFLPPFCCREPVIALVTAPADEKILLPRNNTTINAITTNM